MESFIIYPLAVLFLVLALVVYFGKGDWLIAGYNTASEKEREKIDIKRLRLVMSVLMFISALFVISLLYIPPHFIGLAAMAFIFVCLVGVVVANTWAKKK